MSEQGLVEVRERSLTALDLRAQVTLVQQVMQAVMKPGVHYGTIPGCGDKPTLLKPGSEAILSAFRIAVEPLVTDLSTAEEARFRVEVRGIAADGRYLGSGIGEASSNEKKYAWRASVCQEEWDEAPENQRRKKWEGKGRFTLQVRTVPADIANTVLKMAKKRAQVDMTLTVTAASDCFTQDLEDIGAQGDAGDEAAASRPGSGVPAAGTEAAAGGASGEKISEGQGKRLYAIARGAKLDNDGIKAYLREHWGIEHTRDVRKADYDAICAALGAK